MNGRTELRDILKTRNAAGEIYLSEIRKWVGDRAYEAMVSRERYWLQEQLSRLDEHIIRTT